MEIAYKITTEDKIGVTESLVSIFSHLEIDILQLELASKVIYIKFLVKNNLQKDTLDSELNQNTYVKQYVEVELLPSEKKHFQIVEMFSNTDEGYLITSKNFDVLSLNKTLSKYPFLKQGEDFRKVCNTKHVFVELEKHGFINGVEIVLKNGERYQCTVTNYVSEMNALERYVWILRTHKDVQKQLKSNALSGELNRLSDIVHSSIQMSDLIRLAKSASKTDANILIRGESGTGKELFARGIHSEGNRKNNPFVAINCAAIPDSLLESELFGYEEGTFTGARKLGKIGLFEQAQSGTIFLDEIGDLSLHLQVKLLRLIEQKSVRRLGGSKEVSLDIQIITATNQPLEELIERKQFRMDLYYRLNVVSIQIPPLRYRIEDINLLVDSFLKRISRQRGKIITIDKSAIEYLKTYSWPGNVRELENTIERSVVSLESDVIHVNDIDLQKITEKKQELRKPFQLKEYSEMFYEFEKQIFETARKMKLSSRKLASILNVSHTTIANKLRKY